MLERFGIALNIHQHIMRLVDLVDGISQQAAAPVLKPVHLALVAGDDLAVTLYHRRHLLAPVGVDQKDDFIMSHRVSSRFISLPGHSRVRQG